jgi:endonuclease/exonuclease/phosphatase family metal-dependent hydrolase
MVSLKSLRHCFWLASVLFVVSPVLTPPAVSQDNSASLRVMSFNIRYGAAQDGENRWDLRKERLKDTVTAFAPDLLGTQETLGFQREYLDSQLSGYESLGVGREDGGTSGEMTALFYRADRFEKLEGGHFWLSEMPEDVGSISWDSALPRMATWVKLKDREVKDDRPVYFFNTHFDHKGVVARTESSRLLRRKVDEIAKVGLVVVTGDFNAHEGSVPYFSLFGEGDELPSRLVDSYRVVNPLQGKEEGTFSGFRAENVSGARIDWIGLSRDWNVLNASIDRTSHNGATPSDHFPVTAIIAR